MIFLLKMLCSHSKEHHQLDSLQCKCSAIPTIALEHFFMQHFILNNIIPESTCEIEQRLDVKGSFESLPPH